MVSLFLPKTEETQKCFSGLQRLEKPTSRKEDVFLPVTETVEADALQKMKNRTKSVIAIILSVVTIMSLFSLIIPVVFSVLSKASGVQEIQMDPVTPDSEDKTYYLQELKWKNHQENLKNGFLTSKASQVGYKTSADANEWSLSFVGPYNEVYKAKQINDTTMVFESIALPIGMTEFEVPSEVVVLKLIANGTGEISSADDLAKEVNIDGNNYRWDFSNEATEKTRTVYYDTTDENGNPIQASKKEKYLIGPTVSYEYHRFQIVNVGKSFSDTKTRVEKLKLPAIIKSIDASAFANNPYIKEVYGAGILEVSANAFNNCKNLEQVSFPELRYVRDNAFYKCNHLADLDFSTILAIGKAAFFDCVQFSHVNFCESLQQLEPQAFKQCTGIETIHIPEGVSIGTIPDECFYLCTSLKELEFPNEIINIGKKAFYNCTSLRVLDLRDANIDTISSQAFWGCLNLSYVILPPTIVTFKTDAFDNCPELRYVCFCHEVTDAQLKALAKSELANCVITTPDKEGPSLFDRTAEKTVEGNKATVGQPTAFVLYDVVDVTAVQCENAAITIDSALENTFNGYMTETCTFTIEYEGTYTVTAIDILGNESTYEIVYSESYTMPGDVDKDGVVTAMDARLALRASVDLEQFAQEQTETADMDKDGIVSAMDARTILRKSVGLDDVQNPVLIKEGDVMFDRDGMKITFVSKKKNASGTYDITVKFVSTASNFRAAVLLCGDETLCNTRLNKSHTTGNTGTIKNVRSLDSFAVNCKICKSNEEMTNFLAQNKQLQLQNSTETVFCIKN